MKNCKKFLALFLALVMCLGMLPLNVFAATVNFSATAQPVYLNEWGHYARLDTITSKDYHGTLGGTTWSPSGVEYSLSAVKNTGGGGINETTPLKHPSALWDYSGYTFKGIAASGSNLNGNYNTQVSDAKYQSAYLFEKLSWPWTVRSNYYYCYVFEEVPANDFTLNYNANGGASVSKSQDTHQGTESKYAFTPNATASRTGYTFGGWSTTSGANNAGNRTTSVSVSAGGSKTVYAIWTPIDYTITYKDGKGGAAFRDDSHTAHYDDATPAYSNGTPGNYTDNNGDVWKFTGWNPTVANTVTGSQTYTAKWEKQGPTDNGNGITVTKTRVSINDDANKTTAEGGDEIKYAIVVKNLSNVTKTVTLTEQLTGALFSNNKNTITVTLDPAGQTGSSQTVTATYTARNADKGSVLYNTVAASTGGTGDKENPEAKDEGTLIGEPGTKEANFTVKKSFTGLEAGVTAPQVTLTYVAYRTKDGAKVGDEKTGTVTLTKQTDGTYTGPITPIVWDYDVLAKVAETERLRYKDVVKITENLSTAAVEGYTHEFGPKYSADATVSDNTVTFDIPGATSAKTLWVENSYTKNPVVENVTAAWMDGYSSTPIKTETVAKDITGSDLNKLYPENPTREGYAFDGWEDPARDNDGNITITAKWAQFTVTKAADKDSYTADEDVTWTITVSHNGDSTISGLKLTDTLPGVTLSAKNPSTNDPDNFSLVAGETATFTATLSNASAGTYKNTAKLTKDNKPLGEKTAEDVTVDPGTTNTPDLTITKTVTSGSTVKPGDEVVYQIYVFNNGDAEVKNVVITDELDNNLEFVKAEGSGDIEVWDTEPEGGHYVIGSLAASNQQTGWFGSVKITAKVKAGTPNGTISNIANVKCDGMTTPESSDEVKVTVNDGTPTEYTITVKYVDEEGKEIKNSETVTTTNGGEYDVTDKQVKIDGYTYLDVDPALTGTVDKDTTVTLTYKKDNTPTTDKVTITIKFVDEKGTEVKTVTEKVVKDTEYDVSADVAKLPEGYEANGDPSGDEPMGTANSDKEIVVPVKKTVEPEPNKVTITINFVEEDGTVVKSIVEMVKEGTEYDKTEEVAGIPDGYKANGDPTGGPVTGTADGDVTITVPVKWSDPNTPKPEQVEITIEYVDEEGNTVKTVTEKVEKDSVYDKATEATDGVPEGYEIDGDLPENVTGTAETDVTITVPVKKTAEPEPEQVTITINFVDGEEVIKTIVETVDKNSEYDKSEDITSYPKGYEADGEPTGDPVKGTADGDKTITVPVKKTAEPDPDQVTITLTYDANGGSNAPAADSKTVNRGENATFTVSSGIPTRSGYTFTGWNTIAGGTGTGYSAGGTLTTGEDEILYAQWRQNGGGGIVTPPTNIPDDNPPTTDIPEEGPPLANVDDKLNTTDHFAYIIGYPEGDVRPNANITRAEAVTIFFRLMTDEFRTSNWSTENAYTDVNAGQWYNNALSTASKAGIFQGYEDGTARPNDSITRAEFAALAARFIGDQITDDGTGDFSDTADHWAAKEIRLAVKAGWVQGYPGNVFKPNDKITRAEVMTIVNRMLDRVADKDHMLSDMKVWTDNTDTDMWYYEAVQEATNGHDYERVEGELTEIWTELQAPRDWAALETEWSTSESGK